MTLDLADLTTLGSKSQSTTASAARAARDAATRPESAAGRGTGRWLDARPAPGRQRTGLTNEWSADPGGMCRRRKDGQRRSSHQLDGVDPSSGRRQRSSVVLTDHASVRPSASAAEVAANGWVASRARHRPTAVA